MQFSTYMAFECDSPDTDNKCIKTILIYKAVVACREYKLMFFNPNSYNRLSVHSPAPYQNGDEGEDDVMNAKTFKLQGASFDLYQQPLKINLP